MALLAVCKTSLLRIWTAYQDFDRRPLSASEAITAGELPGPLRTYGDAWNQNIGILQSGSHAELQEDPNPSALDTSVLDSVSKAKEEM